MPLITVEGPPAEVEQKRALVQKLTKALIDGYGFPEDFKPVTVIIKENQMENVGIDSNLCCDH